MLSLIISELMMLSYFTQNKSENAHQGLPGLLTAATPHVILHPVSYLTFLLRKPNRCIFFFQSSHTDVWFPFKAHQATSALSSLNYILSAGWGDFPQKSIWLYPACCMCLWLNGIVIEIFPGHLVLSLPTWSFSLYSATLLHGNNLLFLLYSHFLAN